MNKHHILSEIKRTAAENGGTPLGTRAFVTKTGIKHGDWFGKHWRSWGDAVREAGFEPNILTPKISEEYLLERYALLARELGRAPAVGDLRMAKRGDPTSPSDVVLTRRFGSYAGIRAKVYEYCSQRSEFGDVLPLVAPRAPVTDGDDDEGSGKQDGTLGFVYLIKSGRSYKIGKTNSVGRRERELAIQLPEKSQRVHAIKTDDPTGIEAYWHNRFASKRAHGEWFTLDADDVAAFKRRKFQ